MSLFDIKNWPLDGQLIVVEVGTIITVNLCTRDSFVNHPVPDHVPCRYHLVVRRAVVWDLPDLCYQRH